MQYELAKMIMPFVLLTGGYDSDDQSVIECRNIIDTRKQEDEESHIRYYHSLMDGSGSGSDRTSRRREASLGSISQLPSR